MNLRYTDILRYSPYDNKVDLKTKGFDEIFFINHFLVDNIDNLDQLNDIISAHNSSKEDSGYDKKEYLLIIKTFVRTLNLRELLVYFMLDKIIDYTNDLSLSYGSNHSEKKIIESLVICFDNIDEIRLQALTKEFWDELFGSRSILENLCRNQAFGINLDLNSFMSIILTFRESNLSLGNSQLKDRLQQFKLNRRLIVDGDVEQILKKRTDYIDQNQDYFSGDEHSLIGELIKIFNEDSDWIRRTVLPLFNYDYRKFFELPPALVKQNYTNTLDMLKYIVSYKDFMEVHNMNKRIARGIVFSYLIDYAFNTYFDRYLIRPEDSCNKYRMLLTVMFNLAYPNGLPDFGPRRSRQRPKFFKLKDLINRAKNIFEVSDILKMTAKFFPQEEASYAQWITIYNSDVKLLNDNNYTELVNKRTDELTEAERNVIDLVENAEVYFNASAYAYLRFVVTHYEFFHYMVKKANPKLRIAPLPLLFGLDFIDLKVDSETQTSSATKIPCFEFEKVINLVLNYVIAKKGFIEDYYDEYFRDEFPDENSFSGSHWAFGENRSKRSFYITKVLFTHIDYLENFRYYAWYSADFNQKLDEQRQKKVGDTDNVQTIVLKTKDQIQDFLLNVIKKYIEQCSLIKHKGKVYDELLSHMLTNIENIG